MGLTDGFWSIMGRQARKPSGWLGKGRFGQLAARGHRPLTRWAIGFMHIQPTDRVLDIGCGGGMAIQLIADIAVDGSVAGVDYSENMVQHARQRNANTIRAGRVEIRHGNVSALPYDDGSFDKVIAVETLYFWPDPVPNLQEVRRVVRSAEPPDKIRTGSAQGEPGGLVALAM